ncbi:hypothetical protein BH11BAC2_BH11BAC2_13000 [soil metagenome]
MRFLFIILLFFSVAECQADYSWTNRCASAYDYTMRLNFKKASLLLAEEKLENPENQIPVYIESQIDFLKSFISEDQEDIDGLKKRNEVRIEVLQKHPGKSPYQQLCIAEMYLQMAISRLKAEEYFGSAYDIRRAYKILEDNQKAFPDFKPNLRGLGLIHAAVGSIPKSYQWATNLIGLNGTIQQGLGELKTLLAATYKQPEISYLRDETIVLLTFLELNLKKEKDNEVIRKRFYGVSNLAEKPLLLFAKSVFHFSIAENDSVILLLTNRKQDPDAFYVNYLDFMEGSARLHHLDWTSEKLFLKYVNNYKGKSYVKSAWQRLAWIRFLQGDLNGYNNYMKKCSDAAKNKDITDEDKAAIKEAESGNPPNLILLRARLLFDGGYYNLALGELANKPVSNFPRQKDQLEFTYRLARVFDKQEKKDKAIVFYEQTLKNGAALPFYFAANSALLLVQLYEDQGNNEKAIFYYKKTLEMKNHEFQNSIDQKAKSGLNRMGL